MLQKLKARYGFQCYTGRCLKHSKLAPGSVVELGKKNNPRKPRWCTLTEVREYVDDAFGDQKYIYYLRLPKHHFQHCDAKLMLIILRSK